MLSHDFGRTALLCVVGGSADGISFLRYGTFVGAMTGNTVLIGVDFAEGRFDRAGYHLGIVASFLAAVIVTQALLKLRLPRSVPLVFTALMLGGCGFIASEWGATVAAAALGMQSAAVRVIGGVQINTVFVTGDLLRLGATVPHASAPERHAALMLLTTAWIAYAIGAIAGAVALRTFSYPMFVPALLALVAAAAEVTAARPR